MESKDSYTRYEKTRIISARALQIAQGGPILIKVPKGIVDPVDIAQQEWEAGVIPIDIKVKKDLPHAKEKREEEDMQAFEEDSEETEAESQPEETSEKAAEEEKK